jgi:uncharacterized protein (DUF952 family)
MTKRKSIRRKSIRRNSRAKASTSRDYRAGMAHLSHAKQISPRRVRYYADEIRQDVVVSTADVARLGAMIAKGEPDAYSLWCAETPSR